MHANAINPPCGRIGSSSTFVTPIKLRIVTSIDAKQKIKEKPQPFFRHTQIKGIFISLLFHILNVEDVEYSMRVLDANATETKWNANIYLKITRNL